ncbi:hypothetical protein MTO96_027265 [Rhipicephalus appendiculatus]
MPFLPCLLLTTHWYSPLSSATTERKRSALEPGTRATRAPASGATGDALSGGLDQPPVFLPPGQVARLLTRLLRVVRAAERHVATHTHEDPLRLAITCRRIKRAYLVKTR